MLHQRGGLKPGKKFKRLRTGDPPGGEHVAAEHVEQTADTDQHGLVHPGLNEGPLWSESAIGPESIGRLPPKVQPVNSPARHRVRPIAVSHPGKEQGDIANCQFRGSGCSRVELTPAVQHVNKAILIEHAAVSPAIDMPRRMPTPGNRVAAGSDRLITRPSQLQPPGIIRMIRWQIAKILFDRLHQSRPIKNSTISAALSAKQAAIETNRHHTALFDIVKNGA